VIFSKCSLRISLAGGSTDLEAFVEDNGYGSVISFPCNLYTYITLFNDTNGYNNHLNKYIINYTKREEVSHIKNIENDVAREVLKFFNCKPLNLSFNADVFSDGSGLASSSSYLISCIRAVAEHKEIQMSEFDICNLALKIERLFNPLTGYQDIYGCGLNGFKKLNFSKGKKIKVEYLDSSFLNVFDMYLLYTNAKRKSTSLLETLDMEKVKEVLPLTLSMESSIKNKDYSCFLEIINEGWKRKKETSSLMVSNPDVLALDNALEEDKDILAHKLCGAGNGGYFLIFRKRGRPNKLNGEIKISVSSQALTCKRI
jgi:D-glycero-alpha-D-manno-heptose-7-phosphate kinase